MIKMKAKAGFTNANLAESPRGDGSVLPGEDFSTDWLHAKELHQNKLADPHDPDAFAREPTDAVAPHHGLSVTDHGKIAGRRVKEAAKAAAGGAGGGDDGGDRTKAAQAALERVQAARKALDEAEAVVKDKPSSAARTKLAEAQAEYDAAEGEAKTFT